MTIQVETKFNFKTRSIKDENGAVVKTLKKQPSITVGLPFLTADEVIAHLQGEDSKVSELILDYVNSAIKDQAKAQFDEVIESFGDDDSRQVTSEALDFDKLTLAYIANLPPAQRGGRALTEEDFETFFKDYLAIMPIKTGKEEKRVKTHIDLFKKPTRVKNNKEVLAVLIEQLDVYLVSSPNLEETGEVAQRIRGKFDKWVKEDQKFDLSAL